MNKENKKFFTFWTKQKQISALYTTRHNGFSKGCFTSLNLGRHVGDDTATVSKNREILAKYLDCPINNIFFMEQIHSGNVYVLTKKNKPTNNILKKTDALVTNQKNITLCAMGADCPQIGLYDPTKKVIAVIHAGWKGILNNVIENTLSSMENNFNCEKENIIAMTGAFLCEECFCIGTETLKLFEKKFTDVPAIIHNNSNQEVTINFKNTISHILQNNNILPENINFLDMCTKCNNDLFFSYRNENKKTGRTVLALKLT